MPRTMSQLSERPSAPGGLQEEVGVEEDDGERVVEVVRHHRAEALLLLARALLLGDVHHDAA